MARPCRSPAATSTPRVAGRPNTSRSTSRKLRRSKAAAPGWRWRCAPTRKCWACSCWGRPRVASSTAGRPSAGCADQFALLLENARLTDRVVEQEKVLRDLALAAEVQKRLLPRQGMETTMASLTGFNIPARSVGGDYYDFLDLGGGHTGIALADVA